MAKNKSKKKKDKGKGKSKGKSASSAAKPAENSDTVIKLNNVRISFCQALFTAKSFEEGTPKFSSTFILDKKKNKKEIAAIKAAIKKLSKEKWKKKVPGGLKLCLREGTEKDHLDGYSRKTMFVSASSMKRLPVVDRDLTPVTEEDNIVYAGCRVNATIGLWPQDNKWGQRINANLRAVQFVKDDEAFGADPVDANDEFEDLDD